MQGSVEQKQYKPWCNCARSMDGNDLLRMIIIDTMKWVNDVSGISLITTAITGGKQCYWKPNLRQVGLKNSFMCSTRSNLELSHLFQHT